MPLISIIVPIYKAEDYIHRCVDSILCQTLTDFELLLVDDGSPDKSGEICEEYARKDSRIKVFHKENGGVASARQYGIDRAKGEYTIHADPDDWVEEQWLEILYNKAKEEGADVVVCDYYFDTKDSSICFKQEPKEYTSNSFLNSMCYDKLLGSLWNKLIKRTCYEKYGVSFFKDLNYCEDFLVCAKLLRNNDVSLSYVPKPLYHYDQYVNNNSYTRKYTEKIHKYDCMLLSCLEEILPQNLYEHRVYILAYNEFNNKILSSKDFAKKYRFKRSVLWQQAPMKLKLFMYLSAIGLYNVARPIYSIFQKSKELIKS